MKTVLRTIFITVFLLQIVYSKESKASHATGAELTYVYLSPNTYSLTYTFYRDCSGITPSNIMDFQISNSCGFPTQNINLNQVGTPVAVNSVCSTVYTTCNGGAYTGIEKYVYTGTVILQGECEWFLGHAEPARAAAITTITGAGSDNLYVYCMINNTSSLINSSPVFNSEPIFSTCVGQPFSFSPGIYDLEGDSISVSLITPRTGPNSADTVSYISGYSNSQPLISSLPIFLDHFAGDLSGRATQFDISIYAILVSEFRNGTLIGQIERDMSIFVWNCQNATPFLTGRNGTPFFSTSAFADFLISFYVASVDLDLGQNTSISISNLIPGMSIITTGGNRDSAFVSWTPTLANISPNPYCFSLTVKDDACGYLGINSYTYYITVILPTTILEDESINFSIAPNPVQSELTLYSTISGRAEISVFDLQGRKAFSQIISGQENKLDCSLLENGIYFLSIRSLKSGRSSWKQIVKNSE